MQQRDAVIEIFTFHFFPILLLVTQHPEVPSTAQFRIAIVEGSAFDSVHCLNFRYISEIYTKKLVSVIKTDRK